MRLRLIAFAGKGRGPLIADGVGSLALAATGTREPDGDVGRLAGARRYGKSDVDAGAEEAGAGVEGEDLAAG